MRRNYLIEVKFYHEQLIHIINCSKINLLECKMYILVDFHHYLVYTYINNCM